jgi:hypothetical protein
MLLYWNNQTNVVQTKNRQNYIKGSLIVDSFKRITIEDREPLKKYITQTKHMACDYSVANLILWSGYYDTSYAVENDMLFIRYKNQDQFYFTFPMGNGDLKTAFEALESYCAKEGIDFHMGLVEPEMYEQIEDIFPGEYDIMYMRDNSDYVYNMTDLRDLKGNKYHKKKNHLNKFLKTQTNWQYEQITDENTEECITMIKEWCERNNCSEDKSKTAETCSLKKALKYRKELGLIGGLIRMDGKVIAMCMGERADEDMFIVHFEKALADINGAFQIINQQFVEHELADYKYVNREDDLGVEGLRKAKESYFPTFMVNKGNLIKK